MDIANNFDNSVAVREKFDGCLNSIQTYAYRPAAEVFTDQKLNFHDCEAKALFDVSEDKSLTKSITSRVKEFLQNASLTEVMQHAKYMYKEWPGPIEIFYDRYQEVTDALIHLNEVQKLDAWWSAIYHFDRANPWFEHDILIAARHSNLDTFRHCLYGYQNYSTLNMLEGPNMSELTAAAEENECVEVLTFIKSMDNE